MEVLDFDDNYEYEDGDVEGCKLGIVENTDDGYTMIMKMQEGCEDQRVAYDITLLMGAEEQDEIT